MPQAVPRVARRLVHCIVLSILCSPAVGNRARSAPPETSRPRAAARPTDRLSDESWANWRGPGSRAVVSHAKLPDPWPKDRLEPAWHVRLGTGWSSPVVAEGRVFITDRMDGQERVIALDAATGRELWNTKHAVDFDPHAVGARHGNGPKSTPLVHAGKVYALGIAGMLECLDAPSGEIRWRVNFPAEFGARQPLPDGKAFVNGTENVIVPVGAGQGAPVPLFGYTGSPALWGNLLICAVGGQRGGTVMAFHKDSGRVMWKSLAENVSYSSPVIAELGELTQVVVMAGPRVVGLDLADGRLLWSHPFQVQYDESISTPAVVDDLVLVTADRRPLTALRIKHRADGWHDEVAWTNEILSSYLSSMLVFEGHVYGMNDGGEFACVRLSDGKTMWTGGSHGYYCSPVLAGSRLLGLNEQGELAVTAADPLAYKPLGTSKLCRGGTWTMPAVVGSRIYVRSGDGIDCFELAK
jgi:outer membrane protein assembly factor BamB